MSIDPSRQSNNVAQVFRADPPTMQPTLFLTRTCKICKLGFRVGSQAFPLGSLRSHCFKCGNKVMHVSKKRLEKALKHLEKNL